MLPHQYLSYMHNTHMMNMQMMNQGRNLFASGSTERFPAGSACKTKDLLKVGRPSAELPMSAKTPQVFGDPLDAKKAQMLDASVEPEEEQDAVLLEVPTLKKPAEAVATPKAAASPAPSRRCKGQSGHNKGQNSQWKCQSFIQFFQDGQGQKWVADRNKSPPHWADVASTFNAFHHSMLDSLQGFKPCHVEQGSFCWFNSLGALDSSAHALRSARGAPLEPAAAGRRLHRGSGRIVRKVGPWIRGAREPLLFLQSESGRERGVGFRCL